MRHHVMAGAQLLPSRSNQLKASRHIGSQHSTQHSAQRSMESNDPMMGEAQGIKSLVHAVIRADLTAVQQESLEDAQETESEAEASTPTSTLLYYERDIVYSMRKHRLPACLVLESTVEANVRLSEIVTSVATHPAFAGLQVSATGRNFESLKQAFIEFCNLVRGLLYADKEASDDNTDKAGFFVANSEHPAQQVSNECVERHLSAFQLII